MYKRLLQLQALALLFLLPFERVPSVDVAGVTIRLSSLLILVFIVTGLPWLLRNRAIGNFSAIDKAALVYYGVAWLSVLVASDTVRSLKVMAAFSVVLAGYLLVSRAFRPLKDSTAIQNLVILAAVLTSVFGIYQFIGNSYFGLSSTFTGLSSAYERGTFAFARVQSVGLEPLYFCNYLLLPIFLLLARITGSKRPNNTDYLSLLVIVLAFILGLSRGAYLAALGGIAVFLVLIYLYRGYWTNFFRAAAVGVVAFLISFALIEMVPPRAAVPGGQISSGDAVSQFAKHAAASEQTRIASINPRLETFREAVRLFEEKPALGVGIGNFGAVGQVSQDTATHGYKIVNNQYLETLAETGVLGFVALLGLMAAVVAKLIIRLRAGKDWFTAALAVTVVGIGIQYNFFSTIYILHIWVVIALVDALPRPGVKQLPD